MDLKRIAKKKISDSSGERFVYVWEHTGLEIKDGLYVAKVKGLSRLSRVFRKEVFIWKNQEDKNTHDMFVLNSLDILSLPDVFDHKSYRFSFMENYLGDEGLKLLIDRTEERK